MTDIKLVLTTLADRLAICRLGPEDPFPEWGTAGEFFSITLTEDELSVICTQDDVPEGSTMDGNWRAIKVKGPLALDLHGITANLSGILAEEKITTLAVSTYDTDYLLVKEAVLDRAKDALRKAGHRVF